MKKCCFDVILPTELERSPLSSIEFGIAPIRKLWPNGSTLRVRFLEGTAEQHDFVQRIAVQWSEYANLTFDFNNSPNAEIRITFDPNSGAWSTVGTDALNVFAHQATMNLGWLDEAVVLHEFGHAIGLGHEHQNPVGGIQWNKEQVYTDLGGPPNNWDRGTIDHNMFGRYDEDQIQSTQLDPESIMMYPIPQRWTTNDFEVDFNPTLSGIDKAFVTRLYPKDDTPMLELSINEIVKEQAAIGLAGEQDTYQFTVEQEGVYTIQTEGQTDVFMSLFGPDSSTRLVAEDDDSGAGRNARISRNLRPGLYTVQVRHYNTAEGVGNYNIFLLKETPLVG